MPDFDFELEPFVPGELRQSDAARLNLMVQELASILRLNVDPPLNQHWHNGSMSLTCDIPDPEAEPTAVFAAEASLAVCVAPRKPQHTNRNGQLACVTFAAPAGLAVCPPAVSHCVVFAAPAPMVVCHDPESESAITVRKNSSSDVGSRPRLNFIEGDGISLDVQDDAGGDEIDITVAVSPGTGSADGAVSGGAIDLTGTTTDSFVTVLDYNPNSPIMGHTHLKNTGGSNSLQERVYATDAFGNTGELGGVTGATVIAGQKNDWKWEENQGAGTSGPYVRFQHQVKSTVGGSHTTYRLVGIVGA